jgi:beta-xylosidase
MYKRLFAAGFLLFTTVCNLKAQQSSSLSFGAFGDAPAFDSSVYYSQVKTYLNPVLGGDHPDPTMVKIGDDFYMSGSTFHFNPYLPILHSKDLVHWQEISRVVPSDWKELKSDKPSAGIWQGAITYFYGSYWVYFSNGNGGGQYFSKAASPKGPWSIPVKVKTTATTGPIGYDNSVFIDDDGTAFMLTKAGKPVNRIQKIGQDGHLTGEAINIDWINADGRYSWAEGPVMFKRDGWYYYTFARDVSGGQFIYRTQSLTSDSTKWEALGNFFSPITDPNTGYRVSNHMSAPFQLADGTWWAIAQSYDRVGGNDWSGQGRHSLLHKIDWDASGRPWGNPPTTAPVARPNLPSSDMPWVLPRSDYFESNALKLSWHFLDRATAKKYSFTKRAGWLSLTPDTSRAQLLQKEGGHYYTLVTKVDIDASSQNEQAGIYLTNGDESVNVKLVSSYVGSKKIIFSMGGTTYEADNTIGKTVWLKLDRRDHDLYGYYSADGLAWKQVGKMISAKNMDKAQPDFNRWVGTSIGLFAAGKQADFDLFLYKDVLSPLPVAGYNNFFGVQTVATNADQLVTNTSPLGGWLMLGGVDFGNADKKSQKIEIVAAAKTAGKLEVWIDDIEGKGKLIATIPISNTGDISMLKSFTASMVSATGQHDVYLRFPKMQNAFYLNTLQVKSKSR